MMHHARGHNLRENSTASENRERILEGPQADSSKCQEPISLERNPLLRR